VTTITQEGPGEWSKLMSNLKDPLEGRNVVSEFRPWLKRFVDTTKVVEAKIKEGVEF